MKIIKVQEFTTDGIDTEIGVFLYVLGTEFLLKSFGEVYTDDEYNVALVNARILAYELSEQLNLQIEDKLELVLHENT